MPPSGKQAIWDAVHITRVRDGKLVEHWVVQDQLGMFVGATTPESRDEWIRALDHLAALEPTTVVAGHKKARRARYPRCRRRHQALPHRLRPSQGLDLHRSGAIRRHDRPLSGLGFPPGMAHVRTLNQPAT